MRITAVSIFSVLLAACCSLQLARVIEATDEESAARDVGDKGRYEQHRPGNARPRLSSSLCQLRNIRGAHCDWIASLLNATGTIHHESFNGPSSAGNLALLPGLEHKADVLRQDDVNRCCRFSSRFDDHIDSRGMATVSDGLKRIYG